MHAYCTQYIPGTLIDVEQPFVSKNVANFEFLSWMKVVLLGLLLLQWLPIAKNRKRNCAVRNICTPSRTLILDHTPSTAFHSIHKDQQLKQDQTMNATLRTHVSL